MAKMQQFVKSSRGECFCEVCKKKIEPKETYYKIVSRFGKPRVRCEKHKPHRWELTSSDFLSTLWRLQDNLDNDYDLSDFSCVEDIKSELENLRDECQDRLDNMPEQLQEASTGEILQTRIDSLDSAIDELDGIEEPDEYDEEMWDAYNSDDYNHLVITSCKETDIDVYYKENEDKKVSELWIGKSNSDNQFVQMVDLDGVKPFTIIQFESNANKYFEENEGTDEDVIDFDEMLSYYDEKESDWNDYIEAKENLADAIHNAIDNIDEG